MLRTDEGVRTPRLLLRAFCDADLDDVHALQRDPEVVRYLYWPLRTRPESQTWLRDRIAADRLATDGDAVAYAVVRVADGRFVGSVNAWWRSMEHGQGEVGFVLVPGAQGHGYAYEATSALIDLLFARLGLHRISANADSRNLASARLLARLGMRQEAHLRENERIKGQWCDQVVYAVLAQEWADGNAATRKWL